MTDRIVSVGDAVKVYDINGHRHGQPKDGWDGEVLKVGTKLVHIRYGRFQETLAFRLDMQIANTASEHQSFRTLAQVAEDVRRQRALDVLNIHGLETSRRCELSVEVLEALAAVLIEHDTKEA